MPEKLLNFIWILFSHLGMFISFVGKSLREGRSASLFSQMTCRMLDKGKVKPKIGI